MHNASKGIKRKKIPGAFARRAPGMCLGQAALSTAAFPFKAIPGVQTQAEPSLHTPDIWGLTTTLCLLKPTLLGSQIKVIILVVALVATN